MKVTFIRLEDKFGPTMGTFLIDGEIWGASLEPGKGLNKEGRPVPIPAGTYVALREKSYKFPCMVFKLQAIPGHDNVEIHYGNYAQDTDGCILIGPYASWSIDAPPLRYLHPSSRQTFDNFMLKAEGIDEIEVEIRDEIG